MFNGIIQEIGTVQHVQSLQGKRIQIRAPRLIHKLQVGGSIAVNGACQSVTQIEGEVFSLYSSLETLRTTNLDHLKVGTPVNLELPISLSTPIDGHLVTGHVDGMATLLSRKPTGDSVELRLQLEQSDLLFVVPKGSLCVDGVSLTVNTIQDKTCSLMIIPITLQDTTLKDRVPGDRLNIETDYLIKGIIRYYESQPNQTKGINLSTLQSEGYV
jgi:riboflavin synthase